MRILLLIVATLLLIRSLHGLYFQARLGALVRLACALGIIVWVVTRVAMLGYVATGLAAAALASVVIEHLPRRRRLNPAGTVPIEKLGGHPGSAQRPSPRQLDPGKPSPEPNLRERLLDADASVRLAAAEQLRSEKMPDDVQCLVDRLFGPEPEKNRRVRWNLALALARWGRQEATAELVRTLEPDCPGRREALEALVQLEARQHVPEILALGVNELEAAVTAEAVHAVVRLGASEELLRLENRQLVWLYIRGAPDILPHGREHVGSVAQLLLSSDDHELRDLGLGLHRLLRFAEASERRAPQGPSTPPPEG
jgi:hypothetical protein